MTEAVPTAAAAEPLTVVVDTNAIVQHGWRLESAAWRVLLHQASRRAVRLVVPEVVIREAVGTLRTRLGKEVDKMNASASVLREFGAAGDQPAVDIDELAAGYDAYLRERLSDAGAQTPELPSPDLGVLVDKAIARTRPFADSGSGLRDALLWETVSDEAQGAGVILVSDDTKAFHANGAVRLHPDLTADLEARGCTGTVVLHTDLDQMLADLGHRDPRLVDDAIAALGEAATAAAAVADLLGRTTTHDGLMLAIEEIAELDLGVAQVVATDDDGDLGLVTIAGSADVTWRVTDPDGATPSTATVKTRSPLLGTATLPRKSRELGDLSFDTPPAGPPARAALRQLVGAGAEDLGLRTETFLALQTLAARRTLADATPSTAFLAELARTSAMSEANRAALEEISASIAESSGLRAALGSIGADLAKTLPRVEVPEAVRRMAAITPEWRRAMAGIEEAISPSARLAQAATARMLDSSGVRDAIAQIDRIPRSLLRELDLARRVLDKAMPDQPADDKPDPQDVPSADGTDEGEGTDTPDAGGDLGEI